MNFTDSQTAAITTKGQNVLVSASAGSGKTRVLVERVLRRLLAGENVNQFLIVTFTEAAAAEMKERLETEIRKALANASGQERQHLLKQLRLLNVANISTLHAFALRLIEQYHYTIDLDPQFRLMDDAERTLVMLEVYNTLLETQYTQGVEDEFATFATQFTSSTTDDQSLQDAVFSLYNFATARPDTKEWLSHLADLYDIGTDDFTQSDFYRNYLRPVILTELQAIYDKAHQLSQQAPDTMDAAPAINRLLNLQTDETTYQNVLKVVQNETSDWHTIRQVVQNADLMGWGKDDQGKGKNFTKKHDPALKAAWEQVKVERVALKDRFDKLQAQYFTLDQDGLRFAIQGAKKVMQQLVALTTAFSDDFLTEKLQRKVLDFNDLEHFALQIVNQEKVKKELQAHYSEIMVDEYQDTNQLQEAILHEMTAGDNLFQVGDIKQSIYKFRQADPTLFAHKLTTYPQTTDNTVITLQENFRSLPNVTNFINYIFAQSMSQSLGDIDYEGDAELVAGADYYPDELVKKADLLVYLNDDQDESLDETAASLLTSESYTKATGQIRMTALKIQELMQSKFVIFDRKAGISRPIKYSDITILVPTKGQNLEVLDVFREMNIPIVIDGTENYFQTTEISVMMSFLKVIDNPHQDIPLAAVLRSPLYNITENGLALIRLQATDADFYTAVQSMAKLDIANQTATDDTQLASQTQQKVQQFLHDLAIFRDLAVQNQIVTLLWSIYNETGWLDYVGGLPSGAQRQANLHALYERAAAYQKSSFIGLYQFINYVTQLQSQTKDLGEADANVAQETVSLMTIHHSKGLEFPVVFLLNATRTMISTRETQGSILLDAHAGGGLNYVDIAHHLNLLTPQHEYIAQVKRKNAYAEALRVLYVALTRAEQQLFIVGAYDNVQKLWSMWQQSAGETEWMLPETVRLAGKSFMDLVGMALVRHPQAPEKLAALVKYDTDDNMQFDDIRIKTPKQPFEFNVEALNAQELADAMTNYQPIIKETTTPIAVATSTSDVTQDWRQVLEFKYPYDNATRATSYQSVSEIKRLFEDPDLPQGRVPVDRRLVTDDFAGLRALDETLPEPAFMQVSTPQVSPAAIGTATHLVMQRIDLANGQIDTATIRALIQQLVTDKMIDEKVAPLISVTKIQRFFTESVLGQQMVQHANTLKREVPFSLLLDANRLYRNFDGDDKVLVHGIIDGYFQVGDEVWLFDYKTDHVKPAQAATTLKQRYAGQINIYSQALIAMGLAVPRKFIYALNAETLIELTN
ncbi:helicase-exonuclease AddAB subunit AddA [Weissella sagaensis]|uniref:helicase-exonuclease AddAB subunit AddA n=1 Tax=Weissella sagaensis TaxID=2559928 RepID=UPI0013E9E46B|nr:helicase-exonuclease AddAB subunit AddA [Weissella sagaensis]